MTIQLSSNIGYGAFPAGSIVTLPLSTETALVTQGRASVSAGIPTPGAQTSNEFFGRCVFAPAATSLVVTNPNVTASSKVNAQINQVAADTTFTTVARVVSASGSFTIFANAAATAATVVDWDIAALGDTVPF